MKLRIEIAEALPGFNRTHAMYHHEWTPFHRFRPSAPRIAFLFRLLQSSRSEKLSLHSRCRLQSKAFSLHLELRT